MEAWDPVEKILIYFFIWKWPLPFCFQFWACIVVISVLHEFLGYDRNSMGDEDMSEIRLVFKSLLKNFQFSSVTLLCPILCDPMDCSTPGFPVYHQLPEFTQYRVHWISDAIQPSHHLSSPSPSTFNLSQHQGVFKWVSSSHQVVKILEFQLQHQSFLWIFRTDFL